MESKICDKSTAHGYFIFLFEQKTVSVSIQLRQPELSSSHNFHYMKCETLQFLISVNSDSDNTPGEWVFHFVEGFFADKWIKITFAAVAWHRKFCYIAIVFSLIGFTLESTPLKQISGWVRLCRTINERETDNILVFLGSLLLFRGTFYEKLIGRLHIQIDIISIYVSMISTKYVCVKYFERCRPLFRNKL